MAQGLLGLGNTSFGGAFDGDKDTKKHKQKMRELVDWLAANGRGGDTMVAHINPQEAAMLEAVGGAGTINPATGLPEFYDENGNPGGFGGNLSSGANDAQAQGSGVTGAGSWGSGYSGTAGGMNLANPQGYTGGYASNYGNTAAVNAFRGGANVGSYSNGMSAPSVRKNVTVTPAGPPDAMMYGKPAAESYDFSVGPTAADQQAFQQANPGLISSGNFSPSNQPKRPGATMDGNWPSSWAPADFGYNRQWTGNWGTSVPSDVAGQTWDPMGSGFDPRFSFDPTGSISTSGPPNNIDWNGISQGITNANNAVTSVDWSNPNTYANGAGGGPMPAAGFPKRTPPMPPGAVPYTNQGATWGQGPNGEAIGYNRKTHQTGYIGGNY